MSRQHQCELCDRTVDEVTKHHLIPRTRHANKVNKKRFDRREVKERVAFLCLPCHKQIHALLSEKELERRYNTLELLAAHPDIVKFIDWLRDKPPGFRTTTRNAR